MVINPIQELIDRTTPGFTARPPPGDYVIDGQDNPIRCKTGVTLDLTDAVLRQAPGYGNLSNIIATAGANDLAILGGNLIGERKADGISGERGFGIRIDLGSRNIVVRKTMINNCWMDGVLIKDAYNVELDRIVSDCNRRQAVSALDVNGLHIHHSQLSNSGGTPPGDGIDLECDRPDQKMMNVLIEKNLIFGNKGSNIAVNMSPGMYGNIRIMSDNQYDLKTQPIWIGSPGVLGTPWWAFLLNRSLGWTPGYRYWGYPTSWYKA